MLTNALVVKLQSELVKKLCTDPAELSRYAGNFTYHSDHFPDLVAFPTSSKEVSVILSFCNENHIPIVPYGAGTSVEGHTTPLSGGICVDMRYMNQIQSIDTENMYVTVEAGVRRNELNDALDQTNLFFPPGPTVNATIGGMASTRASGIYAIRYGSMRNNILDMTVVTADGSIMKIGSKARKSSAGYDLVHLFTGAEGTLGVITSLTLKLYPKPEKTISIFCSFSSLESALNMSLELFKKNSPLACIELLDEVTMQAIASYTKIDFFKTPTIFMELHGDTHVVEQINNIKKIAEEFGLLNWRDSTSESEQKNIRQARTDAIPAILALRKDSRIFGTDVCVPVSQLLNCINEAKKAINESGLIAPLFGHIGDGNFHLAILVNPTDPLEINKAKHINDTIIQFALHVEGTCTGEHGIGYGKLCYMQQEHGTSLGLMKKIKDVFDPKQIMNPGKVIV